MKILNVVVSIVNFFFIHQFDFFINYKIVISDFQNKSINSIELNEKIQSIPPLMFVNSMKPNNIHNNLKTNDHQNNKILIKCANFNETKFSCDCLFNLFCLYGNVGRV